MTPTLNDKLFLIDDYLIKERIDPQWRVMIEEYRDMIIKENNAKFSKDLDSKWINARMQPPRIGEQVLCATVYIDEGILKRDYCVGVYDGENWNCACTGDVVTHWAKIEEIDVGGLV